MSKSKSILLIFEFLVVFVALATKKKVLGQEQDPMPIRECET